MEIGIGRQIRALCAAQRLSSGRRTDIRRKMGAGLSLDIGCEPGAEVQGGR